MGRSFALALKYVSNQRARIYRDFILVVNRLRGAAKNNDKILAPYEFLYSLFARLSKQTIRWINAIFNLSFIFPLNVASFNFHTWRSRQALNDEADFFENFHSPVFFCLVWIRPAS